MNTTRLDLKLMGGAGVALLMFAGLMFWRELEIPTEVLIAVAAVLAAAISFARFPRDRPLAGPITLAAVTVAGGVWFAVTRHPLLLPGLAISFLASAVTVWRMHRPAVTADDRLQLMLLWHGLTAAVLVTSAAFYFQFITLGIAEDEIARRLILTLAWIAVGVILIHFAYRRSEPVMRDSGVAFLAVAVGKLLLYDTTHLSGAVRIAGLTAAGALLLLGAWATSRMPVPNGRRS